MVRAAFRAGHCALAEQNQTSCPTGPLGSGLATAPAYVAGQPLVTRKSTLGPYSASSAILQNHFVSLEGQKKLGRSVTKASLLLGLANGFT